MTLFLGYGSLLSARGLGAQLETISDLELARLEVARRFGKPPQKGGRLAMEIECPSALLHARTGDAQEGAHPAHTGALVLHVRPEGEAKLVRREGFPPKCWESLRAAAGSRPIAGLLRELAQESGDDPLAYRALLWRLAGLPKSGVTHYLPHPVLLDGEREALVFVAPEVGESGVAELRSCKAAFPGLRGVGLGSLYPHGREVIPDWSDAKQDDYLELCFLGAAHGVYLADLIPEDLPSDHRARALLRFDREVLLAERAALRSVFGGDLERYATRFPETLAEAWARSGLPGECASD